MVSRTLKKCPYCAEGILADAIKCKHCGTVLTEARDVLHRPVAGKSKGKLTFVGYLGIVVGLLVTWAAVATFRVGREGAMGLMLLFGVGMALASYLWARRP